MFTTSTPQPIADSRFVHPAHARLLARKGKVAVLLNANAKRVTSQVLDAVSRIVPKDDLFFSRSIDEAADIANRMIERRYDVVLAGGGDGTIVQAMNSLIGAADRASCGMYRPPLPDLGVLRLGTGNALAVAMGAGKPVDDILKVLAGKAPQARPVPLIEEAKSGLVFPFASVGYDAQLLNDFHDLVQSSSTKIGKNASKTLGGYFYALFTKTVPAELRSDKARVRVVSTGRCSMMDPETDEEVPLAPNATLFEGVARAIAMGTTPFYGYGLKIFPFADRRTDRFHLRVSTAGISTILFNLPRVWNGTYRAPDFIDFLVEGVRIESTQPLPYQSAGDARGQITELDLRLSSRTFRVLDAQPKKAA